MGGEAWPIILLIFGVPFVLVAWAVVAAVKIAERSYKAANQKADERD